MNTPQSFLKNKTNEIASKSTYRKYSTQHKIWVSKNKKREEILQKENKPIKKATYGQTDIQAENK